MTNEKTFYVRFIANVGVLGSAEMKADSNEDAEAKAKEFLEKNLITLDVDFDIPSSVENNINLQIKEIEGVMGINKVIIDGVADISNREEAEKKALDLVMND